MIRFHPVLLELQRCFFLIGFFHDAIASASIKLISLSVAVPQIVSPREHRAEQHDNLYGCDQRAFLGLPE